MRNISRTLLDEGYRPSGSARICGGTINSWISSQFEDPIWDDFLQTTPFGEFEQSSMWAWAKRGKKNYHHLRYTDKEMRLAIRKAYEQTDEFKDRFRWRAGVEGTMSEYDRRTGVKHLRVRGFKAVRFCATLKAIGVNLFRATAVRRAVKKRKAPHGKALPALLDVIYVVKERFFRAWKQLKTISCYDAHIMSACSL